MMFLQRDLISVFLPNEPVLPPAEKQIIIEYIYHFIQTSLQKAPEHIRLGERVLRSLLWLWIKIDIRSWKKPLPFNLLKSKIALFENVNNITRGLIRLYRTLVVFAFFEHPFVLSAIGVPSSLQHHLAKQKQRLLLERME